MEIVVLLGTAIKRNK